MEKIQVDAMAKAFADMGSDEQAQFLALAYQEMGNYPGRMQHENMGSHGRELQMLSIKRHFDEQPDARAMIEDLYEMTHAEKTPGSATSWDALGSDIVEDIRKAKAIMSADVRLNLRSCCDTEVGETHADECNQAQAYDVNKIPLQEASTTVSGPRITSHCKGLTGVWHKVDDRVRVQRAFVASWGTITKVHCGGAVDVLLDADEQPTYIFYDDLSTDDVVIRDDAAYSKVGDIYLGTVQSVDAGRVVVKLGSKELRDYEIVAHYPRPGYPDERWRLKSSRNAQVPPLGRDVVIDGKAGTVLEVEITTSSIYVLVGMRPESPVNVPDEFIADKVSAAFEAFVANKSTQLPPPDVWMEIGPTCDECKGTGFWTNPAGGRNAKSPCSLGCEA